MGRMAMNKVFSGSQSGHKKPQMKCKFPNGRNDDFVDALAWIGMACLDLLPLVVQ